MKLRKLGLELKPNTPPLYDMMVFCESKGYDIIPTKKVDGAIFYITKENKVIKKGEIVYQNWRQGQIDSYVKLYEFLNK